MTKRHSTGVHEVKVSTKLQFAERKEGLYEKKIQH